MEQQRCQGITKEGKQCQNPASQHPDDDPSYCRRSHQPLQHHQKIQVHQPKQIPQLPEMAFEVQLKF